MVLQIPTTYYLLLVDCISKSCLVFLWQCALVHLRIRNNVHRIALGEKLTVADPHRFVFELNERIADMLQ